MLRTLSPLLSLLVVLFAVARVLAAAGPTPMAGELLAALLTASSSLSVTLALATLLLTALAHPTVLSALSALALFIALSTLLLLAVLTGELLAALLEAALLLVVLLPAAAWLVLPSLATVLLSALLLTRLSPLTLLPLRVVTQFLWPISVPHLPLSSALFARLLSLSSLSSLPTELSALVLLTLPAAPGLLSVSPLLVSLLRPPGALATARLVTLRAAVV